MQVHMVRVSFLGILTWALLLACGPVGTIHGQATQDASRTRADKFDDDDIDFSEEEEEEEEEEADTKADDEDQDREASRDRSDAKSDKGQRSGKSKDLDRKMRVAKIRLDASLPEGSNPEDLFSSGSGTLLDMIRRLDEAGKDDDVDAVVLQIRNPAIGRAKLDELRATIERLRDGGKKVYATLESATPADYLIACACDQIILPESGDVILPGIHAELMFFKRLFNKLGVEADILQVGDYKGAAEPYTREKMSEPFREQLESVLDDYYQQMIEQIAQSRGLSKRTVKALIDEGLFSADEAKDEGLIDVVAYDDEWQEKLLKGAKYKKIEWLADYGKEKVDTDFSGMAGFVRLMELLSGGKSASKSSAKKKIAVVYGVGAIMSGKSGGSMFGETHMGSDTIVEALREASDDDSVAAIVFRVDSPGGSALASDLIWHQIQEIKKPVIASMGDVAGSGGYYVSMGCDKIFAEPGTLTGSIGVVGGKLVTGPMFEKFGLTTEVISRGKNSGLFSANAKFTDSERDAWQAMMNDVYEQFTEKAAAGRDMEVDELLKYAGGRIWTGRQAKKIGLIDELGTLRDAVREAQRMAKLDMDSTPELLILPKPKSVFEQLFEGNSSITMNRMDLALPQSRAIGQVRMLQRMFAEPGILLMPYRLEIR